MPAFEYEATRDSGETVRSVAYGKSAEEVASRLAGFGMQVTSIRDASLSLAQAAVTRTGSHTVPISSVNIAPPPTVPMMTDAALPPPPQYGTLILRRLFMPLLPKVPLREPAFFFRQFGLMMEAGVPIVQSLDTLSTQSRSSRFRKIVTEMRVAVESGRNVSGVMEQHPEVFSPLLVNLIRAGEEGGFLADSLKQAAQYVEDELQLRNMYKRETFMPKLQIAASIIIILGANLIIAAVATPGANTPALESPLTEASTWAVLGPILIGLFLFFRVGLAIPWIKLAWDGFLLYLPFAGKTIHHFCMARFGKALAALYKGGVPITRSIALAGDACGNEYLRLKIAPAPQKLEGGAGIYETLRDTGAFSPIVLNMVSTGESTGNLDQMLLKMSEYYEDEGKVRAKQMANVVGVLAVLAVGVYIGYVVIRFWTGYFGNLLQGV